MARRTRASGPTNSEHGNDGKPVDLSTCCFGAREQQAASDACLQIWVCLKVRGTLPNGCLPFGFPFTQPQRPLENKTPVSTPYRTPASSHIPVSPRSPKPGLPEPVGPGLRAACVDKTNAGVQAPWFSFTPTRGTWGICLGRLRGDSVNMQACGMEKGVVHGGAWSCMLIE